MELNAKSFIAKLGERDFQGVWSSRSIRFGTLSSIRALADTTKYSKYSEFSECSEYLDLMESLEKDVKHDYEWSGIWFLMVLHSIPPRVSEYSVNDLAIGQLFCFSKPSIGFRALGVPRGQRVP